MVLSWARVTAAPKTQFLRSWNSYYFRVFLWISWNICANKHRKHAVLCVFFQSFLSNGALHYTFFVGVIHCGYYVAVFLGLVRSGKMKLKKEINHHVFFCSSSNSSRSAFFTSTIALCVCTQANIQFDGKRFNQLFNTRHTEREMMRGEKKNERHAMRSKLSRTSNSQFKTQGSQRKMRPNCARKKKTDDQMLLSTNSHHLIWFMFGMRLAATFRFVLDARYVWMNIVKYRFSIIFIRNK